MAKTIQFFLATCPLTLDPSLGTSSKASPRGGSARGRQGSRKGIILATLFLIFIICKSYALPNETIQSSAMESNILYKISTSESAPNNLIFSKSFDFGQTFTIPETIIDSIEGCSDIAIVPSQKLLNIFWVKNNKLYKSRSLDSGITFSASREILSFYSSPINLKIITGNQQEDFFHIFWQDEKKNLFYAQLSLNNISSLFTQLNSPYTLIESPIISANNDHIFAAFRNLNTKKYNYIESLDNGLSWKKLQVLENIPSSASDLSVKEFGKNIYAFWHEEDGNLHKVGYSKKLFDSLSWTPSKFIYTSDKDIRSLNAEISDLGGIFIFLQNIDGLSIFKSLDFGASWTGSKKYLMPFLSISDNIIYYLRKSGFTIKTSADSFLNIENEQALTPFFLTKDNFITNEIRPVINIVKINNQESVKTNNSDYTLQFCQNNNFDPEKTTFISRINNEFKVPFPLADGKYFYRLSVWDGIDAIYSQIQSINIDTAIPRILDIQFDNARGVPDKRFFLGILPSGEAKFKISFNEQMDTNQSSHEVALNSIDQGKNKIFPKNLWWQNENTLSGSFIVDKDMPDGQYKMNISNIKDSAQNFFASTKEYSCIIDQTPPRLFISTPEENAVFNSSSITISGSVEIDPINKTEFYMNSKKELFGQDGYFTKNIILKEGANTVTLEAVDFAQNKTNISRTIYFLRPLSIIKPQKESFARLGSTVLVEAQLNETQDIDDETQAAAKLDNKEIESSLYYDKLINKILGFIKIPEILSSADNVLSISIINSNGIVKEGTCQIKIDSKAPEIGLQIPNNLFFSNDINTLPIPIVDKESGPDIKNSSVLISKGGITVEGQISYNKNESLIIFTPKSAFKDEKYSVEAVLRDFAGNISSKKQFYLQIDTSMPSIKLAANIPDHTDFENVHIAGTVDKPQIKYLTAQTNSNQPLPLALKGDYFEVQIPLSKGSNIIKFIAVDLAGNSSILQKYIYYNAPPDAVLFKFADKTIQNGDFVSLNPSIKIVDDKSLGITGASVKIDGKSASYNDVSGNLELSQLSSGEHALSVEIGGKTFSVTFTASNNLMIDNLTACPNPFSPGTQNTAISFNVSKDSNVKIYIFNQAGNIIWQKSALTGIGYNEVLWDGKNISGEIVSNGVYIIKTVSSDSDGNFVNSKSKLIILR